MPPGCGLLRGRQAWNLGGTNPVPAPLAADACIHDLWTSPHGVLRAAQRNNAAAPSEGGKALLTFTEPGRFRATAVIGENGWWSALTTLYDGRTHAVLAAAKQLAPFEPIRWVINSHHHFDHGGGLRTAAAEGVTLVTAGWWRWRDAAEARLV